MPAVPQTGPLVYFRAHKKALFIALAVSLAVTFAFTYRGISGLATYFGADPLGTTVADRAAGQQIVTAKTAASDLDRTLNIFWAFFFLWIPVFICSYWISVFGVRRRRAALLRWLAAAAALLGVFLLTGTAPDAAPHDYFYGVPGSYAAWCAQLIFAAACATDRGAVRAAHRRRALDHYQWFVKPAVVLASSAVCFFVLEVQCGSRTHVIENMKPFNIMYWIIIQIVFYIIFRSVRPGAVISVAAAWSVGFINSLVMQFRGNYIMFGDLTVVRTAFNVAGNYRLVFDKYFFISLAAAALAAVCVMKGRPVRGENAARGKRRAAGTAAGLSAVFLALILLLRCGALYGGISGVAWDYNAYVAYNGYIPYFLRNANAIHHIYMSGGSAESAGRTIGKGAAVYDAGNRDRAQAAGDAPNILVIQNAAFSDLSVTYDIDTDIDCMPFIKSVKKDTRKGYVDLSIKGGPTANSEFEFLTGGSMAFMTYGSVPFTQYMKKALPNIVTTVESQDAGYRTIGYHPYYSSGYARRGVYSLLGFDESVFYDKSSDTDGMQLIRGMVSDRSDYEQVEKMCEENDDPVFIFNVTIQNHGGYTGNASGLSRRVHVTNFDAPSSVETYLSLVRESDDAFRELTEYLSGSDEKTIVLMYGDHQPSFDEEAEDVLDEHKAGQEGTAQTLSAYRVPYVIWANYDIEERDDMGSGAAAGQGSVSLNYLGPVLLENAGLDLSAHDKYLLQLAGSYPSVTAQNADADAPEMKAYKEVQFEQIFNGAEMKKYFEAD